MELTEGETEAEGPVCAVQGSKQAQILCNINSSIPNKVEQSLLSINPKGEASKSCYLKKTPKNLRGIYDTSFLLQRFKVDFFKQNFIVNGGMKF